MTSRLSQPEGGVHNVGTIGVQSSQFSFDQGRPIPQQEYRDNEYGNQYYDQRPVR